MKPKQRILNALKGEAVDRLPWSPNLAYWWQWQSHEVVECGEMQFLLRMGADPLIRGHFPYPNKDEYSDLLLFKTSFKKSETSEITRGDEKLIVYSTPVGILKLTYRYMPNGNTWFMTEHGVKTREDFKVLKYLFDDMVVEEDYALFNQACEIYGDEALLVPMLCPKPNLKSSFQSLLEYWVGTEELIYAVSDYPETVEDTLESMKRVTAETAKISSESKAEAFITWEDTSTTNISPVMYEKYILPEINGWCDILHNCGKLYIQHACGHLKNLIPLIAKSKIDCIESISPPPTGNIEIWEAKEVLPSDISLIGGIEPTVFLNSSVSELKEYTEQLIKKMKGSRFILANSDSCPPGVTIEKFQIVSELVSSCVY